MSVCTLYDDRQKCIKIFDSLKQLKGDEIEKVLLSLYKKETNIYGEKSVADALARYTVR